MTPLTGYPEHVRPRGERVIPDTPLPLSRLALLHLAPGVLTMVAFVAVGAPLAAATGAPPLLGFLLVVALVLVPVELGYLLMQGRQRSGRLTLAGVLGFTRRLPARRSVPLVAALLVWTVASNVALVAVDRWLFDRAFWWLPASLLLDVGTGDYSRQMLVGTLLMSLLVSGIVAPIVEEWYFRGFLLPRMARFGAWAPVVNMALFALYHVWTPWLAVTRVIFFLPTVYAVWRTGSYAIALWVHVLGNSLGTLAMLAGVLSGAIG